MKILLTIGLVQLLAVMSPGPSFLITARTAVSRSRLDGVKVALGLGAGTIIWASLAVLGLHVVFEAVPQLKAAMQFASAGFLIWIAVMIFRHAKLPLDLEGAVAGPNPFWQGFITQVSNPKVVVFFGSIFIAMLPHEVPFSLSLGLIAVVTFNEVWWYSAVALFFGSGPVRAFYLKAKAWIDRVTAVFLGFLGLKLAWGAIQS
jgi:threonine/homoserine/homoserine lactone efflux protein